MLPLHANTAMIYANTKYPLQIPTTKYMKRILIALAFAFTAVGTVSAQAPKESPAKYAVATNSFWSNWYVQVGLDMSLQNPYKHNFAHVFPNGKTFGVNAAAGRWFTPGLGLRAKVNWENGIKLFENGHAAWLAPFHDCGVNMDKGGYLAFVGDIQLDIHNLFFGYDEERLWNFQVYPRAGGVYCFGVSKGSPLLGFGIGNTFRIDSRFKIYFDIAYNVVSSGFVGVEHDTGQSGSNGYFDINVGLQINLGNSTFKRVDK